MRKKTTESENTDSDKTKADDETTENMFVDEEK